VAPGETLYRIGLRYGVAPAQLTQANHIDDPTWVQTGQVLCIPRAPVTQKPPKPVEADPPLRWPLKGVLYARFGKRGGESHDGIDLAAPAGTLVRTAGAGQVLFAGEQPGYGLLVIVEHAPGWVTLYAHNRELRVHEGERVSEGQVVATVGESGHTTGPHLHFELRHNGLPIDPLLYLGQPPSA
jgi:murein DD-endopeptidase MepM/ murein hydrolase activator NlpD